MKRTLSQNSAIHLYFTRLSDALNDGGYDVNTTIKVPVSFTSETVKKYMFKPIMKALYPDKTSTTELSTTEIQIVYENLNRLTSEKFGIGIDLPSEQSLYNEAMHRFNKQ